jgi:hypothetical protein
MMIAKLAKLPVELAGYVRRLPQLGAVGVVREAFQLGDVAANPIAGFGGVNFSLSGIFIILLLLHDLWARVVPDVPAAIGRKPLVLRWAGYDVLLLAILISWNIESSQFIYFTF